MADPPANVPPVIALVDLPDLRWQVKPIGGAFGHDLTAVLEQLEAAPSTFVSSVEDSNSSQRPHRYLSVTTLGFMKWGR